MELSTPLLAGLKVAGGPQVNDEQFTALVNIAASLLSSSLASTTSPTPQTTAAPSPSPPPSHPHHPLTRPSPPHHEPSPTPQWGNMEL